jgi:hypothetical protein
MRELPPALSLEGSREKAETILKSYELFIYEHIHYIAGAWGGVVVKTLRY